MKRIVKKIIYIWVWAFTRPLRIIKGKRYSNFGVQMFMKEVCREAELSSSMYVSHTLRPRKLDSSNWAQHKQNVQKTAVILQGPIVDTGDFTLNTIKYYLESNNDLIIIVSTWKTADRNILDKIEKVGAYVVQSEQPEMGGHRNINYQLISMQAGIKRALELQVDYICKTRTDQRIENPEAFAFMRNMISMYPVSNNSHFEGRIVALGAEFDSMFVPYYISDFIYFGLKSDMKLLLSIPLDTRTFSEDVMSRKEVAENKASPESYIIKTLFEKSGVFYDNTIKDYWTSVKDSLILLDMALLGLYWPKYDERYCEHTRNGTYRVNKIGEGKKPANFNFLSWLSLMMGDISYDEEYEKYLELPQTL